MPSAYAHYRFGTEILPGLPADVRRPIQRFRRMFDMGLQGPDPFFYYNILTKTTVGNLGKSLHSMSGQAFFTTVCRRYQQDPSEAGEAYLYGLLCHYCLDSVCHPFIKAIDAEGKVPHVELETEFDRFLLARDGKTPPHTYNRGRHISLSKGECVTVSGFYPPVTPANMHKSVSHMAEILKFLASPRGPKRTALKAAISVTGEKFSQHVMPPMANPKCAPFDEELMVLYTQALDRFPVLAEQFTAHLTYNAPLGEDFVAPFS